MAKLKDFVQWQTVSGEKVSVAGASLTPQSQFLSIRLPFGGWVWNRPVAVLVERDGQVERIPVVDVTRLALLGLAGVATIFSVFVSVRMARERRKQNEQSGRKNV